MRIGDENGNVYEVDDTQYFERVPTLRDQFAMHAINGLVHLYGFQYESKTLAKQAYRIADAMIEQREKQDG